MHDPSASQSRLRLSCFWGTLNPELVRGARAPRAGALICRLPSASRGWRTRRSAPRLPRRDSGSAGPTRSPRTRRRSVKVPFWRARPSPSSPPTPRPALRPSIGRRSRWPSGVQRRGRRRACVPRRAQAVSRLSHGLQRFERGPRGERVVLEVGLLSRLGRRDGFSSTVPT